MRIKIWVICFISLLFIAGGLNPVFAYEHTQKDRLFSINIPGGWHWFEYPQEIIITFPDAKTMAIDIQYVASRKLSPSEIKSALKESDDKMIKDGILAHNGTLIDSKEISLDGVYARQLDFKSAPPDSLYVTYIAFFNKGYAFTITYGSPDEKMRLVMDDAVATLKFNK